MQYDDKITLKEMEKNYIKQALAHHNNDKTLTAKALGICLKTLYNKLKKYSINTKEEKTDNVNTESSSSQ